MIILSQDRETLQKDTSLDLSISDERIKDFIDIRILRILKENSRIPNTEIAEIIGVSEGTIRRRINRLIEEGVINRFTIEIKGL